MALPAAAAGDTSWHLGLTAAEGRTTVLADNLPGQPYVLVRQDGSWHEPSGTGVFGSPLPTASPTSLVPDNGQLVMSVDLFNPGQVLGNDERSVALLTSTDGVSWQMSNVDAFQNSTVNQLLPVPAGLLAVGSRTSTGAPLHQPAYPWTDAFASLSVDGGITWPNEPINPATLGDPPPTGPTTTTTTTTATTTTPATTATTTTPTTTTPTTTTTATSTTATTTKSSGAARSTTITGSGAAGSKTTKTAMTQRERSSRRTAGGTGRRRSSSTTVGSGASGTAGGVTFGSGATTSTTPAATTTTGPPATTITGLPATTTTTGPAATTTTTGPAATTTTTGVPHVEAPLAGPFSATAAGRLGNSLYIVGQAGPQAVGWFSPDGVTWHRPEALDITPQLATELALATCGAGNSAVVVGSATTTGQGAMPAAWSSTDGSAWTSATFAPGPVPDSYTQVDGCLSTGNGFIAYGGSTGTGQTEQPVLWSSADGTSWKALSTTFTGISGGAPVGLETAPLDGVAFGTATWLGVSGNSDAPTQVWPAPVGGEAGAVFTPAGLWSSVDAGNTWQQVATNSAAFAGTFFAQADAAAYVGQQPIIAGTVDGQLAVWTGTPASANTSTTSTGPASTTGTGTTGTGTSVTTGTGTSVTTGTGTSVTTGTGTTVTTGRGTTSTAGTA